MHDMYYISLPHTSPSRQRDINDNFGANANGLYLYERNYHSAFLDCRRGCGDVLVINDINCSLFHRTSTSKRMCHCGVWFKRDNVLLLMYERNLLIFVFSKNVDLVFVKLSFSLNVAYIACIYIPPNSPANVFSKVISVLSHCFDIASGELLLFTLIYHRSTGHSLMTTCLL